jgi:hypothetical protein
MTVIVHEINIARATSHILLMLVKKGDNMVAEI